MTALTREEIERIGKVARTEAVKAGMKTAEKLAGKVGAEYLAMATAQDAVLHFEARLEARIAELEAALKPFAELASAKGGTPKADQLKAIIGAILENSSYPDDIEAINEFCNAVLAARAALQGGKT